MNLTFNRLLLSSVKRGINASMSLQFKNAPQFVRFYSVQQPSDASTEVKATENSSKAELSPEDQFKILYERSKRKVWGGLKEIRDSSKYVNQKLKRKEAFSNTDIDALLLSAKWINDYHNVVRVIKAMHNAHRVFKFRHVDVFVEAFLKAKKYDLMIRTLIEPELSFGAYLTNDTANMLVQELLNIPEQAEHAVKIVSSTTKRGLKVISKDVLIKVAQYQVEKGAEMKEILRSAKFILPVNEFEEFKSQFETKKDEKEVEEVKEAKEA